MSLEDRIFLLIHLYLFFIQIKVLNFIELDGYHMN